MVNEIVTTTWAFVVEAAPFILFGFALAGLLHGFVRRERMLRWIGRRGPGSVVRAAVVGVPLPLCSCGVVPVAAGMRREGADRGATTSFLIATPESGVDSIAVSWALLDPLMTVFRPLAAFVTAIAGGLAQQAVERRSPPDAQAEELRSPGPEGGGGGCCSGGGCCGSKGAPVASSATAAPGAPDIGTPGLGARLLAGARFAFVELFDDMGGAILLGLLVSGVLVALLPEIDATAPGAWGGLPAMLAMLVLGVPLYVCATGATPLAAALIAKGLSPGAALVFLLAGPATNLAGLTMLAPILGRRGLAVYLGSVVACALAFGLLLDALYPALGLTPQVFLGAAGHDDDCAAGAACLAATCWAGHAAAVALLGLAAAGWLRRRAAGWRPGSRSAVA